MDDTLVDRVLSMRSRRSGRTLIGIAGCPGSGKTTLVSALLAGLEEREPGISAWVPMDGFHLADTTLRTLGRLDAKGAIDTFDGWGYLSTLRRIRSEVDHTVYAPEFDRAIEQPIAGGTAVPRTAQIVVTEGNYLLDHDRPWTIVRDALDEVWYCDVDDDIRVERLVARHIAFGKSPAEAGAWVATVDEVNAQRIRACRDRADAFVSTASVSGIINETGFSS